MDLSNKHHKTQRNKSKVFFLCGKAVIKKKGTSTEFFL